MTDDPRRGRTDPAAVPADGQAYRPRRFQMRRARRRPAEEVQDLRTPSGRRMLPY
ncbi:hypothetical protein ACWEN6_06290 [Sphaerisporangium sp. NPDC004334]